MPRNASGTYALPSGNPISSGTLIDATWANNTLNDLANEMTDSLSRSGEGGMLAPFRLNDGVQATPGLAFSNEPSTGLYRAGSNEMWAVAGGTQVLQVTSNGAASRFAPGAVTTPSITALGDLNTGLWFPAADTIAASTGGSERLRVDSSGNLGIGTASPAHRLDVAYDANAVSSARVVNSNTGSSATATLRLDTQGATWTINNGRNGGYLSFSDGGGERARFDNAGNLGIGTASPGNLLDVVGTATGSGIAASVRNNATTGNSLSAFRLFAHDGSTVANSGSVFLSANSWTYQQIAANQLNVYGIKAGGIRLATANSGPIIFAPTTGADADFATEAMRITPAGNIVAGASAALATTATNGFLYVPTCAGTPTGTPTAITGMAPIVVNTTNNKLYFYSGGAWRDAGP